MSTPGSSDAGGGLSGVAIRRPVFTAMMMLALVVLGLYGLARLSIDQFPEVDIPVVTVQTVYPGASPETIEQEITRRLEEAFNPVEGVETISSVSLEGVSQVIVEFELGRDVDQAAQDIRGRIDAVRRELPEDIEPPVVQKFDPGALPIMSLALSSDTLPLARLTTLAEEVIRRRLEAAPGVGLIDVTGGLEREVRIYLLSDRLQALGITVTDVIRALEQQNLEVPAGRLEGELSERLVRVTGRITDVQQFGRVIIAERDGNPVRLTQVARVLDATEDERSVSLVNGQRAVSLDVQKVTGANTVQVADAIKEAVRELQASLPQGVQLRVLRDNSIEIRNSVESVLHELLLGSVLTVLIVLIFLNDWRATVITALALPVSVISSFILMYALGFTLNVLTLMALSLSIGILIDDAIVVTENIVRHRELGASAFAAARDGTREIFLAVLATTLSIVAVFIPVAFMGGVVGQFFLQFGTTVAWAVLVSLFVAFTLTPMLAAHWGVQQHRAGQSRGNALARAISRFNEWFDRQAAAYRRVIRWALGHRKSTIALAVGSLIASFALFPFIGGSFTPESDESQFSVQFETPVGSSLAYTRAKAEQIGRTLRELAGVEYTYTTVGAGATGTVNEGSVYVQLVPPEERELSQNQLMVRARERLTPIIGTDVAVLAAGGLGDAQAPLQIQIRGPSVDELERISSRAVQAVERIPGVVDVQSSMAEPRPELRIDVNRDLANALGLDIGRVAATIRPVLAGQTATTWEDPTGEEHDVVVQIAPEERRSLASLRQLPIATGRLDAEGGALTVQLGEIAEIEERSAAAQINRENLERVATISATNAPGTSIAEASAAIRAVLAELSLPPGYSARLGGETQDLEETSGYVLQAIILSVTFIFLILASQFESIAHPFAIMTSLPLSIIGVLLALWITDDTLNMMSMIGVLMLLGLVTKNAILLVDNANARRAQDVERSTALIEAGAVRLRPIVMTTLAMIFGMLPIALALGEGGSFRAPMARAVIGGLITSTVLTLVVVPVAYTYFDDMAAKLRGLISRTARTARAK